MNTAAEEKYASIERLAPTVCATLVVVLPISAVLHMPDVMFFIYSFVAGLMFFLGWQATLRRIHAIVPVVLFLSGFVLAFAKIVHSYLQMPAPLFYLQGLGVPAFSFFLLIWCSKLLSRRSNAD